MNLPWGNLTGTGGEISGNRPIDPWAARAHAVVFNSMTMLMALPMPFNG